MSLRTNEMGFRTNANGNGPSDQWYFGPMGRRTNGNGNGLSDHRHGTTMSLTPAEQTICYRKQARYLYYRLPCMHRAHFTPCLHGVYIVHTLPVRVLREAVKMSSAFPRPTISAANGGAIIAAFPLKRLHHRMRPVDADLVYTSTGQVALTILLENGGLTFIFYLKISLYRVNTFSKALFFNVALFVHTHGSKI